MFNLDGDTFLHSRMDCLNVINEEYLKNFILQYEGTDITDYVFNINSMASSIPSRVKTSYAEKYLRKEEYGQAVDYTNTCCKTASANWNQNIFYQWKFFKDFHRNTCLTCCNVQIIKWMDKSIAFFGCEF